jgi:hypothetical protein
VKFTAQFVLAERRGVFQGLNVQGTPVEITRVRAETAVEVKIAPPPLPYHLAAFIRGSLPGADLTAGLRYVNRLRSGFYEIEAALRFGSSLPPDQRVVGQVWFGYVVPLR